MGSLLVEKSLPRPRSLHHMKGSPPMMRGCLSPLSLLVAVGLCVNIFCFLWFFVFLQDKYLVRDPDAVKATKVSSVRLPLALSPQALAVVVPAHSGDLQRAVASLARWPTACSPVTLKHVELVLYYAEGPDDNTWSDDIIAELAQTGGRCFARTSAIFGNLTEEENVYPKGPSVQFYKMFLDDILRDQLSSYDALAIIEWDVLVAHDDSFEKLHQAAFGSVEPFWVKGSVLAGTNFHGAAAVSGNWHMLGHINGNAIYDNSDPAFVEFVNFTLQRWKYDYSYDVALWATIADFPYSWPLWQRYSSKFVTTNLIANVGFLEVDQKTVSNAVAGNTMFIHGSLTGGGGVQFVSPKLKKKKSIHDSLLSIAEDCKLPCGGTVDRVFPAGTSTVCDRTCSTVGGAKARFGGLYCGAGNVSKYGAHCRLCYEDVAEAREAERSFASQKLRDDGISGNDPFHVMMCDTMRPPEAEDCNMKCAAKSDTICDRRCGTGHFDDYNCNWRNHGANCRFCFDDLDAALAADETAKRKRGRVIMCDTHEAPVKREMLNNLESGLDEENLPVISEDEEARVGNDDDAEVIEQEERNEKKGNEVRFTSDLTPFTKDLVNGELCAITTGYFNFLAETAATVKSVGHFMPGMRVVVATDPPYFSVFNRTMGHFPGAKVVNGTTMGGHASLLADKHCGEGTKLIYYLGPGEFLSRTFTQKDTHSTKGDLLVPFTELQRLDEFHVRRARATTSVLGFDAPSFSYSADLLLPAKLNRQLRQALCNGADDELSLQPAERTEADEEKLATSLISKIPDAFVPELLAGLAYSQNPTGMWFLNAQQWVVHHMFKEASIWDIPLIKPRYGCSTSVWLATQGYDVGRELDRFIDSRGRQKCETGFMPLEPSFLKAKAIVEFGEAVGNPPTPTVESLQVSVVYKVKGSEAWLLNSTIPTVIQNFPGAMELIIVVKGDAARRTYTDIVKYHEDTAVFPIRVVMDQLEEDQFDKAGIRKRFPLIWSDKFCSGKHVMHLHADSVILKPLTYKDIFHFRKPVLPYTRHSPGGNPDQECWHAKAPKAIFGGEAQPVVHDFFPFDNHVYPVSLYRALRSHLLKNREGHLTDVMSTGDCDNQQRQSPLASRWIEKQQFRRTMQYGLMSTFMWYHMHDNSVFWKGLDPLDMEADAWLTDPQTYVWSCNLGARQRALFGETETLELQRDIRKLASMEDCRSLRSRLDGDRN